jgi:GTPase
MKPVVALVGRPNVGKSTLFNRLTRSRDALVADFPGLTRDRHYGDGRVGDKPFLVVDTGGFEPVVKTGIVREMAKQTEQAVVEADVVIFIVDGREGLSGQDHDIARFLRKQRKQVLLCANKCEGMRDSPRLSEFHELGLGELHAISAAHGDGIDDLIDVALKDFEAEVEVVSDELIDAPKSIKLAVIGRPNVGKSTFINAIIGEERLIAFDMPGTTRDAIAVPFERDGRPYTLIDTAGLRRRGKVFEAIEKFSVVKTLQAIDACNVAVMMFDATQDIADQDAHIAGYALEKGRAMVAVVNKWDAVDEYQREQLRVNIERKVGFLRFVSWHRISATKKQGLAPVMKSVDAAHEAAYRKLSTPKLTRALIDAVEFQQPRRAGNVRPKLRYAHQGGQNPPLVIVHGTALSHVTDSYKRYLEGRFRELFELTGTPLRIELRTGSNPFVDKR